MSLKSASTLLEVPSVTSAVENLQMLAVRMQEDTTEFAEEDVATIDSIIEAVTELHQEGNKIVEKLETETIKASVLRHTLQFLPQIIKTQIQDAVSSARKSNEEELNRLQEGLTKINDNIVFLKGRHDELEQDNSVLHPERADVRAKHDDIITQLNKRMAEKATSQIVLNETRDKLRETNHKIVDLEEGIIQLKEDLIQERADARMEKKRLKKAVYDTSMKTREQKDVNVTKKKELDGLLEEVFETESQLDEVRGSIRKFELSKTRQEAQEQLLIKRLEKETQMNEDLKVRGVELEDNLQKQEETFVALKEELENHIKATKKEIKVQEKSKKKGAKVKEDLEKHLTAKLEVKKIDEQRVKEENAKLQEAKQDLALKAEDAARLRQENEDMEKRIEELTETHQAIVTTFQKQIEELREHRDKERKGRMELQGQKDAVQKDLDDIRLETQRYLSKKNKLINLGKQEHDQLTREGTQLQKQIREDEANIRRLQEELNRSKTDLDEFQSQQEGRVKQMEDEIADMSQQLKTTQELILEKTPSFVELEQYYGQRTEDYDKMKKHVVALKNKKLGLEDGCRHSTNDVEKLINPTAKLRDQLNSQRKASMVQLKQQAVDRSEIEKLIYSTGCKLRTAIEENEHFTSENEKIQLKIVELDQETVENEGYSKGLEIEVEELKKGLWKEWEKDEEIQQIFAARDTSLVEALSELLEKTGKRENIIGDIGNRLDSELAVLGEFLENVAKRRPKSTSKPVAKV